MANSVGGIEGLGNLALESTRDIIQNNVLNLGNVYDDIPDLTLSDLNRTLGNAFGGNVDLTDLL